MVLTFGYTVLYVDDVARTLDFYIRAFGLAVRHYDPNYEYGELDTGATRLAFGSHRLGDTIVPGGFSRYQGEASSPSVEISFVTSDVRGAYERAVGAGALSVVEPKTMPWGQMVAYIRSPEGTLIALSDQ